MNTNGIWTGRPAALKTKSNARHANGLGTRPNQISAGTRTRTNGPLAISMAAMTVLLSACALAPGMRMDSAPSIPISSAGDQGASDWLAAPASDIARTSSVVATSNLATTGAANPAAPASDTQLAVPISDITVALI